MSPNKKQQKFRFTKDTDEYKFLEKLFAGKEISPDDRPKDVHQRYANFAVVPLDAFRTRFNQFKAKYGVNLRESDDTKPTVADGVAAAAAAGQAGVAALKAPPPPSGESKVVVCADEDSKMPAQDWVPSQLIEVHTNSMEARQTVVGAIVCQSGISSVEEIKISVVAPDCNKILIQQLVCPAFHDPNVLIGAYSSKKACFGGGTTLTSRLLAFLEACKSFCGGKKKSVWATTYVELPVQVDKHLKHMKLVKKGSCYVFVFELNSAEGDDWNNIDTADEIIDLS